MRYFQHTLSFIFAQHDRSMYTLYLRQTHWLNYLEKESHIQEMLKYTTKDLNQWRWLSAKTGYHVDCITMLDHESKEQKAEQRKARKKRSQFPFKLYFRLFLVPFQEQLKLHLLDFQYIWNIPTKKSNCTSNTIKSFIISRYYSHGPTIRLYEAIPGENLEYSL